MALLENLDIDQLNNMVPAFNKESDRGAAILAGSFLEHYLGLFLRSHTVEKAVADKLFGSMGPLATFSQRIAIAYAFGFIDKEAFANLEQIRKIRNHFAHNPINATFDDDEVKKRVLLLSTYGGEAKNYSNSHARQVYLFTCALFCGKFNKSMRERSLASGAVER
ncbi:MltR family transcriptional regulator [Herbaspirillum rhizosphaerae]|uniref:MltR family transcriptional regulator n=1 Tax=Herbaspirillum rhizosphaerae TaxID=346179 RepID=UPI00067C869C|nr:MltR family transcriptional regulator [Herbaspirillum rhizosphaerae]